MAIVAANFDLEVFSQRDKVVTATENIYPSFAATLGKDATILDAVFQLIVIAVPNMWFMVSLVHLQWIAVPGQANAQKLAEDSLFRLRRHCGTGALGTVALWNCGIATLRH
jgi:hypothetical protein